MSFIQVFVNGYIQMINEYLIQKIHSCRKTDTFDLKSLKKVDFPQCPNFFSLRKKGTFETIPRDFGKLWIDFAIDIRVNNILKYIYYL